MQYLESTVSNQREKQWTTGCNCAWMKTNVNNEATMRSHQSVRVALQYKAIGSPTKLVYSKSDHEESNENGYKSIGELESVEIEMGHHQPLTLPPDCTSLQI